MKEQEKYEKAKKRVEEIKGFYTHLFIYLLVNLMFFVINILTAPGVWWFLWPLVGWGIFVFVHGFSIFVFPRLFGKEWEEKKIKEIMEKETPKKNE